jgi:hypothetical protein
MFNNYNFYKALRTLYRPKGIKNLVSKLIHGRGKALFQRNHCFNQWSLKEVEPTMEKTTDQRTDQEQLETCFLAEFPRTWGVSRDKNWNEAIHNALEHWQEYGINEEGKVKLWMAEVSEDFEVSAHDGSVKASKIENSEEVMVDAELLKMIQGVKKDLEVILENICMDEEPAWDYMNELNKP